MNVCIKILIKMEINSNIISYLDKYDDINSDITDMDSIIKNHNTDFINTFCNLSDKCSNTIQNMDPLNLCYDFNPDEFLNFLPESNKSSSSGSEVTNSPSSSIESSFSNSCSPSKSFEYNFNKNVFDTHISNEFNHLINFDNMETIQDNCYKLNNEKEINPDLKTNTTNIFQKTNGNHNGPVGKLTKIRFKRQNNAEGENVNKKHKMILLPTKDFKTFVTKYKGSDDKKLFPKIIIKSSKSVNGFLNTSSKLTSNKVVTNFNPLEINSVCEISSSIGSVPFTTQKKMIPILPASTDSQSFKLIATETQVKKHERMIKNRKSASLSRMKKKVYMTTLENRVKILEKENSDLKTENLFLRNQLELFQEQSHLHENKTNTYDFIKIDNNKIFDKKVFKYEKTLSNIMSSTKLKKNTAMVLGMLFMVTLNFGTFNNFLLPPQNSMVNSKYSTLNMPENNYFSNNSVGDFTTRRLLWSNDIFKNKNNGSKNKFQDLFMIKNLSNNQPCPMYVNQSENIRIAYTLQKWMDENNNYLNMSSNLNKISKFNELKMQNNENKQHDKKTIFQNGEKKIRLKRETIAKREKKDITESKIEEPNIKDMYSKLFENIDRRDDTFYIVSFNTDHILLPPFAYNKTSRHKVSLMLPNGVSIIDGKTTLMQIDCEIVNTTVIDVKEKSKNERSTQTKYFNRKTKSTTSIVDKNSNESIYQKFKGKAFQNIYMTVLSNPTLGLIKKTRNDVHEHVPDDTNKYFYKEVSKMSKLLKPYFVNND